MTPPTPIDRWLAGRAAPWICVLVTATCVHLTWTSWSPWPLMHDEWAYWTQAWQYASNTWAMPSPPVPEFSEQLYVLVTPVFASKHWPGHAIRLAPGFAIPVGVIVIMDTRRGRHRRDIAAARTWIGHDCGADNSRLIQAAQHRTPYRYGKLANTFTRMVP